MARLKEHYLKNVAPALTKEFSYTNAMAVPKMQKITINIGLGEALTHPALHNLGPRTAIANWFMRKRPPAFAIYSLGRSVSGILMVPIAIWIMDVASWRWVYVAVGAVEVLLLAPLCWLVVRKLPEDVGLRVDGDDAPPPAAAGRRRRAGTGAARYASSHMGSLSRLGAGWRHQRLKTGSSAARDAVWNSQLRIPKPCTAWLAGSAT